MNLTNLTKKQIALLGRYCFSCGDEFTHKDIDGGRCSCGSSIGNLREFEAADEEMQEKILDQIAVALENRPENRCLTLPIDDNRHVEVKVTHEGIIVDLWDDEEGEFTESTSAMWDDLDLVVSEMDEE